MSHDQDWTVEPPERGWLGRLIAPHDGGRPASAAVLVGVLGAAAFVGSLIADWQTVNIDLSQQEGENNDPQQFTINGGLGTVDTLTLVYVLGLIALLGLLGAVVTRPDLAARLRLGVFGVGVGLMGVVVAMTVRLPDSVTAQGLFGGFPAQYMDRIETSYQPGVFFGYAAVILPVVAIWLASRPHTRTRPAAPLVLAEQAPAPPAESTEWVPIRPDGGRSLTVSASEPLHVSTEGDGWARPQR